MLKFDIHSNQQGYQFYDTMVGSQSSYPNDQQLIAKVARLTNEGKEIGPGSYNVHESELKNKKGSPNMGVDNTMRSNPFANTSTSGVGPGSYQVSIDIDRKIRTQTIPRAKKIFRDGKKKRIKNRGSIRADFEEGDSTSEEGPDPGPGNYLRNYHVSTFGQ